MKNCLSDYFSNKIKINSYQHLDGLLKEKDGVKYYEGYFNAEIKFISNYSEYQAGDEYKILTGVLQFIKTENGWNCQEFDFTNSELIKLNKFENKNLDKTQIESPNSVNSTFKSNNSDNNYSEDEIKNVINNYYQAISTKNFNEFYNIFNPLVDNFFGKANLTVDQIINENINYQNRWTHFEIYVDTNSFVINPTGNNTDVSYNIFYKVKKKESDNWKTFNLKMNIKLNNNLKILSIYEIKQ